MDDDERHKNIIVPTIYSLLCLFVTAGGVILVLYVFFPSLSQPWHPIAALILIGSPWLVWLLTLIYSCAKACFDHGGAAVRARQIPKRQVTRNTSAEHNGVSVASSASSEVPLASSV